MFKSGESDSFSVPWTGFDVFLFFALWVLALNISGIAGKAAATKQLPYQEVAAQNMVEMNEGADSGHPIAQLVQQSKNNLLVIFITFFSVVVVVPIIEEMIFRLFLQGWLEATLSKYHFPYPSFIAVVAVSFVFAAFHSGNHRAEDASALFYGLAMSIILFLLLFAFCVFYLAKAYRVKFASFFWGKKQFTIFQYSAGIGFCLLTILFLFGLNIVLGAFMPDANVTPVPLFFFSLVLGFLYVKTRNLSYCILLHALLNGISFTAVLTLAG